MSETNKVARRRMYARYLISVSDFVISFHRMRLHAKAILPASFLAGVIATAFAMAPVKKLAKQFLNVNGEKPPGYTHVVTSPPGKMVFISGRGGAGADGKMPADFTSQAKNTFEDLKRCLALGGATFKDVVKINYYVTDMSNTAELRKIRSEYLDMEHPPAATLVQAGLGKGSLLEIEAVAVVPE
jgi:2-iminobutanoate/2-iminopropanoate deaminase